MGWTEDSVIVEGTAESLILLRFAYDHEDSGDDKEQGPEFADIEIGKTVVI